MLFNFCKKLLPKISVTERIALNSGSNSIDNLIFKNAITKDFLHKSYKSTLTKEENNYLSSIIDVLNMMIDPHETQKNNKIDDKAWQYIKDKRMLGLCIPTKFGGLGYSPLLHSKVVEKISSRCPSSAVNVMVPNSLGPSELLLNYGTTEQKFKYLPLLASGKIIPCFGLTGPYNGSDASSIITDCP